MPTTDTTVQVTGAANSTPILPPVGTIVLGWTCSNWTGVTGVLQVYIASLATWIDYKDIIGTVNLTANDMRIVPGGMQYRIRGTAGAQPIVLGYDMY